MPARRRFTRTPIWSLAVCSALLTAAPAPAQDSGTGPPPLFPFVLPWDDDSKGPTDVSAWLDRPAGKLGPVVVRDGHLYTGPKRLRLLGVNLCFGANFPTHADADKVAGRLAKFGVNAVRFHHMDMQTAPGGILSSDIRTLDPGALDRLDYLIARLKDHGIYADLNLHVSRTYPGLPTGAGMPSFHKGVDNFDPTAIRLQRDYARNLLTHVNPYTKSRYADEPAVALVEINNENGLIHEWWTGQLDAMPDPFAAELTRQWNAWLAAKYPNDAVVRVAWGATSEPLGPEMLSNGDFARGLDHWYVERHEGAEADAKTGGSALRVNVKKPGREGWHVQFNQSGLALTGDRAYTLTFRARADAPRRLSVNAMQAHAPWKPLWSSEAEVTTAWKTFRFVFRPDAGDENARVGLSNLATKAGLVEVAGFSLRPGGVLGLEPGETLGTIAIVPKSGYSGRTPGAQRDWVQFLWDVEDRYWSGMARYLKDDLKVRAPLVGTQMGWSPATIQAKLDVIDSHAYWQHPHFPGRSWDMANWTVGNLPMAGRPDGGTLPGLALSRVAGKPFICTEYNHSAPNSYASETLPLIAAFAAMQDWDGVFLFAYSHRTDDWGPGKITSFFDIDQHPTKMATFPAAAALFLRGDVPTPGGPVVARPKAQEIVESVRRSGPHTRADAFGLPRETALRVPVALGLDGPAPLPTSEAIEAIARAQTAWRWVPTGNHRGGAVRVDTPRSKVLITHQPPSGSYEFGKVTITPGKNRNGWSVLTLTALDGPDFRSPGRVLITATGDAENTAMRWTSAEHNSVGADWGRAPSLVEGVAATVTLPVPAARVRAWPLDARGQRLGALAVTGNAAVAHVALGPEHKTLWYEVEIRP